LSDPAIAKQLRDVSQLDWFVLTFDECKIYGLARDYKASNVYEDVVGWPLWLVRWSESNILERQFERPAAGITHDDFLAPKSLSQKCLKPGYYVRI